MRPTLGIVFGVVPIGEDRAEDRRVQGLDAAVEERRVAGQFAHVAGVDAGGDQVCARAPGRIDRHTARDQVLRQFDRARAIVKREERGFAPGIDGGRHA